MGESLFESWAIVLQAKVRSFTSADRQIRRKKAPVPVELSSAGSQLQLWQLLPWQLVLEVEMRILEVLVLSREVCSFLHVMGVLLLPRLKLWQRGLLLLEKFVVGEV